MLDKIKENTQLTKVSIICYEENNLKTIKQFIKEHNYKALIIKHNAEEEDKKEHYHIFIFSNYHHLFRVKTLVNETQTINLFSKTNWDTLQALRYCLHLDYDYKTKYNYSDMELLNYTRIEKQKLANSINEYKINTIEDSAIYNIEELYNKIFNRELTTLKEIKEYCGRTNELKKHYILNINKLINYLNVDNKENYQNMYKELMQQNLINDLTNEIEMLRKQLNEKDK